MKDYFTILYQSETERLDTEAQIAVYRSIKSFSANGTRAVALSSREIARRTKLSQVYVLEVITQLTLKEVIRIVGKEKRLGGQVNIYEVITPLSVKSNKVLTQLSVKQNKVITTASESDNSACLKNAQDKRKEYKEINKESISLTNPKEIPEDAKLTQRRKELSVKLLDALLDGGNR